MRKDKRMVLVPFESINDPHMFRVIEVQNTLEYIPTEVLKKKTVEDLLMQRWNIKIVTPKK